MFDVTGKTALVTGGSTGIGLAIARSLAQCGARIGILARSEARLAEAVAELKQISPDPLSISCDLNDVAGIPATYSSAEDLLGPIDILVNNAGINLRARADEMPLEDWEKVIRVNLTAPFVLSQEWAKRRIASQAGGCIVFTSSFTGRASRPTISAYSSSKAAVTQLTKALAVDWAPFGIRVNAVAPGFTNTDLNRSLVENLEFSQWVQTRTPLGRWGMPEDVGPVAAFLASDAARFVTGQTIFVDGGWSAAL